MQHIYPYKMGSHSARALRDGLSSKSKLIRPDGRYRHKTKNQIINWGNSTLPTSWVWNPETDLNNPLNVKKAANKLLSFEALKENNVQTPKWTNSRSEAQELLNSGHTIVVRHVLNGHSGQGIEIISEEEELPQAPLYVTYKKKFTEFRVHVFKGEVIDTQQKKVRDGARDHPNFNSRVRSHANGWVFCRLGIAPSPARDQMALAAINALKLDFGAVDIIYNQSEDRYYVLEINTAPGLEGTTLQKYLEAILRR